jgi:hypothetical protein
MPKDKTMNAEEPKPENPPDEAVGLLETAEELIEEVIDLEECAKADRKPPRAKLYRFKVNETVCTWPHETILGRQILEQAGLTPPKDYTLREKMSGGVPRRIELEEKVDLRKHGVEKFRAIKKGQHEGEAQGRRGAPVLEQDRLFLDRYGLPWESIAEGCAWVLLHGFPIPEGANRRHVTVALRMETGYPITQLDMMYVYPPLARNDGRVIPQTNSMQTLDGKQFQRWSRHRTPNNPWVPGQDSLETHIYLIEEFFQTEFSR